MQNEQSPSREAVIDAIRSGFMTSVSGDGSYRIEIKYPTLPALQAAHSAILALLTPPTPQPDADREAKARDEYRVRRIAEVIEDNGGCWRPCSGCQEGDEGYVSTKHYPYDPAFRCQPGSGCSECGGIGVIWEDGEFLASYGDALADATRPQVSDEGNLVDKDTALLALFNAIRAIKIGNPTDDKLILENLRSEGFWLCRFHPQPSPAIPGEFDPIEFGRRVADHVEALGISYREAAEQAGMNHATLNRISRGGMPDLMSYFAVTKWMLAASPKPAPQPVEVASEAGWMEAYNTWRSTRPAERFLDRAFAAGWSAALSRHRQKGGEANG